MSLYRCPYKRIWNDGQVKCYYAGVKDCRDCREHFIDWAKNKKIILLQDPISRIKRIKGITRIDLGRLKIITDKLNRHRFNYLRKLEKLSSDKVYLSIRQTLK